MVCESNIYTKSKGMFMQRYVIHVLCSYFYNYNEWGENSEELLLSLFYYSLSFLIDFLKKEMLVNSLDFLYHTEFLNCTDCSLCYIRNPKIFLEFV